MKALKHRQSAHGYEVIMDQTAKPGNAACPVDPEFVDQDAVVGSVGAGFERIRSANTAVEDIARAVRRAKIQQRMEKDD